jgi:Ca-activated chloride channel family protein
MSELCSADVGLVDRVVDAAARARVLLARVDEARGEARALADRGQFEGAAAVLRKMIQAAQAEPWFAAGDGSDLAEAVEQILDEALALERRPSREAYSLLRKTQFTVPVSADAQHKTSSPMSVSALRSVAGPLPPAALVVQGGPDVGKRYPLGMPKAVIGRTASAEIHVRSPNISRQHAMIAGQSGRYVVLDLGSTNTTEVNGQAVVRPHPLVPGDVIRVGDVELRYEEDAR